MPGVKGWTIHFDTARKVKAYLITAATLFFYDGILFFENCLRHQQNFLKSGLSVRDMDIKVEQRDIASRLHTVQ